MSAPAILLSTDGKSQEKVKVSAAQSLVRQLLAVELIAKKLYQRVEIKSAAILRTICKPFIPDKLPSHKTPGTRVQGPLVEKSAQLRFRIMQSNQLGGRKAFKMLTISPVSDCINA